jgi:hypothetical protein
MSKKLMAVMLGCFVCFGVVLPSTNPMAESSKTQAAETETEAAETEAAEVDETETEVDETEDLGPFPIVTQANDVVWQIPAGYIKDDAQSTDDLYVYRNEDKTVCILVRVKTYNDSNPRLVLADIGSLTLSFTTQNDFSLISSETTKVDGARCELDKFQCGDAYYTIYSFISAEGCYDFVYSGLTPDNADFADAISTINIVKDGEAAEPILPEPEEEGSDKVNSDFFKGKDLNSLDLMSEEVVKEVQTALNAEGFDCGTPDGKFGSKSQAAMQEYEKEKGINVTTDIGPEFVKTLFNIKE